MYIHKSAYLYNSVRIMPIYCPWGNNASEYADYIVTEIKVTNGTVTEAKCH